MGVYIRSGRRTDHPVMAIFLVTALRHGLAAPSKANV